MAARIASHRNGRPAHWAVVEEPRDVEKVVAACDPAATLILDCLTLWVANLVEAGLQDADVRARASSAAVAAARRPGLVVVVSNEVGSGIVPADHLSRRYRDLLGNVNSVFAAEAEEAYLVVAGRLLALSRPADVLASAARAGSAGAS
jgi:adenosyl cobinamide kinase/adenosyl cobinamide phosphate guanylyltransferase